MNAWIFQSVPERYDLRDPALLRERTDDTWYATRYRNDMQPGDLVFFWLAGEEEIRGVYAWGRLTSKPYWESDWDSYGVNVRYEHRIEPHISVQAIRENRILSEMLILRAPQATNFLLSREQARELVSMIQDPARRPGEV